MNPSTFCTPTGSTIEHLKYRSAQFREILDGVPLGTPQIMQFIGEYLKENMDALQNGESEDN